MEIRNIAIIAHVDHGKTTLTDALLHQTGAAGAGVSMDSNELELERGITIYSKNASLLYKGTKINIIDTPGHADFSSEVERVLRSIDSVLLLVDAGEGPMPQTRFVLRKALELGLNPIVVINKIDKVGADPHKCEEAVLGLFLELGANDKQANFPIVYASSRQGIAKKDLDENSTDLTPLLETILAHVPASSGVSIGVLLAQPFNLGYDNFLGRLAVVRVYQGALTQGEVVYIKKFSGEMWQGKINKLFTFSGLDRVETQKVETGDIALIAGLPDIFIGDTITDDEEAAPLPAIAIDEPTITLNFFVNSSPFAGRDGKFVTSRQLQERLKRELEINVGLQVNFDGEALCVSGRGELHIAVLLEHMRREGYELQISQPHVITRMENGVLQEPFEEIVIDVPTIYQGSIIERLGARRCVLKSVTPHQASTRLIFEGPTRGLLGYHTQFILDTKGEGIFSSRVIGFRPHVGAISRRSAGSMTSMATGKALGYALWNLQDRGTLYITPGVEVYEGMVIGNTSKGEEMAVNPLKGKQLTNTRASGSDEAITLQPPYELTIERGLEVMGEDEYLEITPHHVRLRKQYLSELDRVRARRGNA